MNTCLFAVNNLPKTINRAVSSYYQEELTYYPILDPHIIISDLVNDEEIESELKKIVATLQHNQKIIVCTYFRDKSAVQAKIGKNRWFTFRERKFFLAKSCYKIFVTFSVITIDNSEKKNQKGDFEVLIQDLGNKLGNVAIFKITKDTLLKDYIDYFKYFLGPDVKNSLKNDKQFLKQYHLQTKNEQEINRFVALHIEKVLEAYRQQHLYWDRVRDILYDISLKKQHTLHLDMLSSSKEAIPCIVQFKIGDSVRISSKKVNDEKIIEIEGFQNIYNIKNRNQIFEILKKHLLEYQFDTQVNVERYRKYTQSIHSALHSNNPNQKEPLESEENDLADKQVKSGMKNKKMEQGISTYQENPKSKLSNFASSSQKIIRTEKKKNLTALLQQEEIQEAELGKNNKQKSTWQLASIPIIALSLIASRIKAMMLVRKEKKKTKKDLLNANTDLSI
ncbi:MAG: hypothetical protein AAF770_03415 [Bacteroidota bacterium]